MKKQLFAIALSMLATVQSYGVEIDSPIGNPITDSAHLILDSAVGNNIAAIAGGKKKQLSQLIAELFEQGYLSVEKIRDVSQSEPIGLGETEEDLKTAPQWYYSFQYLRIKHILMERYPTAWALVTNQEAMINELKRLAWFDRWIACIFLGFSPEGIPLRNEGIQHGWVEMNGSDYRLLTSSEAANRINNDHQQELKKQMYCSEAPLDTSLKGEDFNRQVDQALGRGTVVTCYECDREMIADENTTLVVYDSGCGIAPARGYWLCSICRDN